MYRGLGNFRIYDGAPFLQLIRMGKSSFKKAFCSGRIKISNGCAFLEKGKAGNPDLVEKVPKSHVVKFNSAAFTTVYALLKCF